jgi:uncharacterized protein (TIGR02147 family)
VKKNQHKQDKKASPISGPDSIKGAGPDPVSDSSEELARPNIFCYHQYVEFLKDWFSFQKKTKKGFSLRKIAQECEIAIGYLPMVLSKQRPLSVETLKKLMPVLQLSKNELQFLESMHSLGISASQEERVQSLDRMKRHQNYRKNNPNEAETFEYLTRWYYFAIRELSADPEFKLDAEWIQERLRIHIPLKEIKDAIEFLVKNKYIEVSVDGKVVPPQKHINCSGGVYRIALGQQHKQLLRLAEKSIDNADSSERQLVGHTFAIPASDYDEVQKIISEALEKLRAITKSSEGKSRDAVYHMEMALFPLTKNKTGSKE